MWVPVRFVREPQFEFPPLAVGETAGPWMVLGVQGDPE